MFLKQSRAVGCGDSVSSRDMNAIEYVCKWVRSFRVVAKDVSAAACCGEKAEDATEKSPSRAGSIHDKNRGAYVYIHIYDMSP